MRAAVFIRYHSGDGFGHLGWAFEVPGGLVSAGSVENHSGHVFTPASRMGFWNSLYGDPTVPMRDHGYDDLKWIDVDAADPILAYRTVQWIKHEAYKALHRNCEDDVYDVLRAFGVDDLALPSIIWFPKSWFGRFRGALEHAASYRWPQPASAPRASTGDEFEAQIAWQPTWRRPWHPHFHGLKIQKLELLLPRGIGQQA